jgi:hypothetical protein
MSKGKRQPPAWLAAAVANHGARAAAGKAPRTEAADAIAAAVRARPEYVEDLIAADVKRYLTRWLAGNGSSGDLLQASLFPDLPVRMRVSPGRSVEVTAMTSADLDHARNILLARTQNAINGATKAAEGERAVFTAFYDRVRPLLLADGQVVRDVLPELAAKAA